MQKKQAIRVITCGLRYADYGPQRELFALRNNGDIEIVAEIGYDLADPEIFGKRMTVEEALACAYDGIVVCGDGVAPEGAKVLDLAELTAPHYAQIGQAQMTILKELVEAPPEQLRDREWLKQRIYAYGFYPFFKLVKELETGVTWSTKGVLQVPGEFLDFCLYLTGICAERAIEIGVARGGSSYIMAALLYRNNPDLVYHMVDICDDLIAFEQVQAIIPALRKDIPKTSDDFAGQAFDFCFIDADHSYDGMMRDWENVGRYAKKVVAFHDIYGHEYDALNGGTVRGWQEIRGTADGQLREYSRFPERWMGIGVVERV